MGMRDTKLYGQQEDLTENLITVPLPKSIIRLLADISNKQCEATATEIEEVADFQIYMK